MAVISVKQMRARAVEAMKAEALSKDGVRAAYCRGVQDALAWATTGEDPAGLAAMTAYLAEAEPNGLVWT